MSLTLRQICLVVEDLQKTIADLTGVLGIEVCYVDPVKDGRGEGLGGIDIKAAKSEKILKSAQGRGLKTSAHQVIIGGLRFNLT